MHYCSEKCDTQTHTHPQLYNRFSSTFFLILYQKLSLQSFKNFKAKMYSFEVSKSKISASEPQKMMVLCRFETMTLLMTHLVSP